MTTQLLISSVKPSDLVFQSQTNQLVTNSFIVSKCFGKLHKNVIQKIESLECSSKFASANFSAHTENIRAGAVNRDLKCYQMTKDGFMFLVMGFTGKKAAQIKEAYINAFNEMERQLTKRTVLPSPANPIDHLNFMHQRWLVVVEKGKITHKRPFADDEIIMDRTRFIKYFNEPESHFNDIKQLIELSKAVNERLCQQISLMNSPSMI